MIFSNSFLPLSNNLYGVANNIFLRNSSLREMGKTTTHAVYLNQYVRFPGCSQLPTNYNKIFHMQMQLQKHKIIHEIRNKAMEAN
jgi:hypothetical protein